MRLFVAINLEENMKEAIMDIQASMMFLGVQGNFTKPDNMHLTLAFIGEYPDPDMVVESIGELKADPFEIRLEGLGSFGKLWWVGIQKNESLAQVVRVLRRRLAEGDIPFDRKKFKPHITIVRKPHGGEAYRPDKEAGRLPEASMVVDHISLMRSDRGKHGMIYTELVRIPLENRA
jgi:2'-5' RNA ligase